MKPAVGRRRRRRRRRRRWRRRRRRRGRPDEGARDRRRRRRTPTRRRSATPAWRRRSSASSTRTPRRARSSASCPSPARRSSPATDVTRVRLRRLPAARVRQRPRRAARERRRRASEAEPIAKSRPAGEGPDLELRRQRGSRSRARARSSCATCSTRTPRRRPLTKEGERFRDLAWAPTADVEHARDDQERRRHALAEAKTSLCFGAIGRDGMEPNCKDASENVARAQDQLAPGRQGAARVRRQAGRQRARHDPLHAASSRSRPTRTDWERKGFVTDTSKPGAGRARRRVSRPTASGSRSWCMDGDGTTNLFMTKPDDLLLRTRGQAARRARVQGDLAAGRPRSSSSSAADDCLGSADRRAAARAGRQPAEDQQSLGLTGDNPTFQPLSAE